MSKKLYSTPEWKRYIRSRQRYQLRQLQRRRRSARREPRQAAGPRARRGLATLTVPRVFSVVRNPEETIAFLRKITYYGRRSNITLDLAGISEITTDAIAALIATIQPMKDTVVRGNIPTNLACQEILVESGFFKHVRTRTPQRSPGKGMISEKKSKKVEPAIARDLIHFGTGAVCGSSRRCPAAYRTMIESMNNTHNHAGGKQNMRETWWSTVYAEPHRNCVCFTFLDTGVGIFRSVRIKGLRKAYRLLGLTDDAKILREILEGKVESSTGEPHRGKGLPAIYKLSLEGRIRSLVIVANDVYANVDEGVYMTLRGEFGGTLLYWEIPGEGFAP